MPRAHVRSGIPVRSWASRSGGPIRSPGMVGREDPTLDSPTLPRHHEGRGKAPMGSD